MRIPSIAVYPEKQNMVPRAPNKKNTNVNVSKKKTISIQNAKTITKQDIQDTILNIFGINIIKSITFIHKEDKSWCAFIHFNDYKQSQSYDKNKIVIENFLNALETEDPSYIWYTNKVKWNVCTYVKYLTIK